MLSLFYRWQSDNKKLTHIYTLNKQQSQGLGPGICILNHSPVLVSDHIIFHLLGLGFLYIAYRIKQKTLQQSTQSCSNYLHLPPPPTLFPTLSLLGSGLSEILTLPPYQALSWFYNFATSAVSCLSDPSSPLSLTRQCLDTLSLISSATTGSIRALQVLSTVYLVTPLFQLLKGKYHIVFILEASLLEECLYQFPRVTTQINTNSEAEKNRNFSFSVWKAKSPKRRCQQNHAPAEGSGKNPSWLLPASGDSWCFWLLAT